MDGPESIWPFVYTHVLIFVIFFVKQKTAYEMRISDWSSDVCSSDLTLDDQARGAWVAFAVAQTLEVTLNVADGGRANGFHDHLGRLLGIEVAQWWRPTAENFFGRVKKEIGRASCRERVCQYV